MKDNKIHDPTHRYFFNISINKDLDCQAKVSPYYTLSPEDNFTSIKEGSIGDIQFKDISDCTIGIITHEAVHCATSYLRMFEPGTLKLDVEDIDKNEEELAWWIGYFTKGIVNWYKREQVK